MQVTLVPDMIKFNRQPKIVKLRRVSVDVLLREIMDVKGEWRKDGKEDKMLREETIQSHHTRTKLLSYFIEGASSYGEKVKRQQQPKAHFNDPSHQLQINNLCSNVMLWLPN